MFSFTELLQLTWALTKGPVGCKSLSGPTAELPQQEGMLSTCKTAVKYIVCKRHEVAFIFYLHLPLSWHCFVHGELLFRLSLQLRISSHTSWNPTDHVIIRLLTWTDDVKTLPDLTGIR